MSALFTYQVRLISAILDLLSIFLSFLKQVLSTRQMKKVLILKKSSYICTIFPILHFVRLWRGKIE